VKLARRDAVPWPQSSIAHPAGCDMFSFERTITIGAYALQTTAHCIAKLNGVIVL